MSYWAWNQQSPGGGGGAVTSVFSRTGDVVADPDDYDELTKLDVVDTFSVSGNSLVVDADGNVGIGTLTPIDFGVGVRNVQVDDTLGSSLTMAVGGTRVGSMLAFVGVGMVLSTDAFDLSLGTNGISRIMLSANGDIALGSVKDEAFDSVLSIDSATGEVGRSPAVVRSAVFGRMATPGNTFDATAITAPLDTATRTLGFTQTLGLAEFTATEAGTYRIAGSYSFFRAVGNGRSAMSAWIEVNGAPTPSSTTYVYSRQLTRGEGTAKPEDDEISLSIGDVVRVRVQALDAGITLAFEQLGCFFRMERVA